MPPPERIPCPSCHEEGIPVRPVPLLDRVVRCENCGFDDSFRSVLEAIAAGEDSADPEGDPES